MDVKPSDVVRDLGVLLDSELTLKHHVNRIATAERLKDGADPVWHQDITATPIIC